MGIFSSIANAVSGFVGGPSFGAKEKEYEQIQTSTIDLDRIRKDADASGFNPLTVLKTVGGGFSTVQMPSVFRTVQPTAFKFGQMAKGVADTAMSLYTGFQGFKNTAANIANTNAQTDMFMAQANKLVGGLGSVSSTTLTPSSIAAGGFLSPSKPKVETPSVTNPHGLNSGLVVDANYPDAEMCSDRYGDIAEEICGLRNFIHDSKANNLGENGAVFESWLSPAFSATGMTAPSYHETLTGYENPAKGDRLPTLGSY